jgi:hypothetical protein
MALTETVDRSVEQAWRLRPVRRTRVFYTAMAVVFLVTTFAGFAPTYFLKGLSDSPPLGPLLHVHGLVFTSWLILLLVQTTLVARHRVDWHRRLGVAGAALAAIMVPLGMMTGIVGARQGFAAGGSESLAFLIFPLGQMVMFGALMGAAIWKRRQPESHRRLILLATAVAVTPAISRLPLVPNAMIALLLSTLFVVAGIVHDWTGRRRLHPIYAWGGLAILASGPLRFALGQTAAWQSFARFLVERT